MIAQRPQLQLSFGPDRSLIWEQGQSVRYLVADISATGTVLADAEHVPLNLALAVDVSGSMSGEKIEAARATAAAVVDALTFKDRLSIVAFDSGLELLLESRRMDAAGRRAAHAAIARLQVRGSTNLHGGWDLAAAQVARAMGDDARASHRVLLLTDGHANVGVSDAGSLARFAADAQRQGILTSAVGIGDGYDEGLLSAMVEAGGGRLHDATDAQEVHEVVIGELLEGRSSLVERTTLRVTLPAQATRAEVVGHWSSRLDFRTFEVMVGSLRPDQVKRVVIRVFCDSGMRGLSLWFSSAVRAQLPDGSAELTADVPDVLLTFADEEANSAQIRDPERTLAALTAWQGAAIRRALQLNGEARYEEAKQFLRTEIALIKRYARGVDGARALLRELDLLLARVADQMDERVRKEVYVAETKRGRGERDHRSRQQPDMSWWFLQDSPPR